MSGPLISVYESTDPKLSLSLTVAGTDEAFDLTDYSLEFYIKTSVRQSDADAQAKYVSGDQIEITDPATSGNLTIQCDAEDLTPAGRYVYKLDGIKSGRRDTLLAGEFIVQDV